MNEKYVEALEQYEMDVISVRKGRGSWICETRNGCRLLKEYRGTVKRLEFEDEVLGILDTRGSLRADRYIRNKEGSLLTMTGDGTRYILKDWFMDRECNIKDGFEIRQALSRLAMLHGQLRTVEFKEEWSMGSILSESLEEELERHNRENPNLSSALLEITTCFMSRPWRRCRGSKACGRRMQWIPSMMPWRQRR